MIGTNLINATPPGVQDRYFRRPRFNPRRCTQSHIKAPPINPVSAPIIGIKPSPSKIKDKPTTSIFSTSFSFFFSSIFDCPFAERIAARWFWANSILNLSSCSLSSIIYFSLDSIHFDNPRAPFLLPKAGRGRK